VRRDEDDPHRRHAAEDAGRMSRGQPGSTGQRRASRVHRRHGWMQFGASGRLEPGRSPGIGSEPPLPLALRRPRALLPSVFFYAVLGGSPGGFSSHRRGPARPAPSQADRPCAAGPALLLLLPPSLPPFYFGWAFHSSVFEVRIFHLFPLLPRMGRLTEWTEGCPTARDRSRDPTAP